MAKAFARGRILATTDFDRLAECDAILICVPTPLGRHREPDLSFIRATGDEVARRLRPGQLVVLESTTYPGTTREELLPRFEARGLACGEDFFLAFSPEREDPGNTSFHTQNIPKVVGGMDPASLEARGRALRRRHRRRWSPSPRRRWRRRPRSSRTSSARSTSPSSTR